MLSPAEILELRKDFPIFYQSIYNKPCIYLDNASTTQKPLRVMRSIDTYYRTFNANVHRGIHYISQLATKAIEESRESICRFINASNIEEIIFTKGTTESINLLAASMNSFVDYGDEIILSEFEHHSNIVPWQLLSNRKKLHIRAIPIDENSCLNLQSFENLLNYRTKLVAINHISNIFGVVNPIKKIIEMAHSKGVWVFIDGAQGAGHTKIDVRELNVDFYAFSAHKMYGPNGIGVLYGKKKLLEKFFPWQGGGEMIKEVSYERTLYAKLPYKLEAGSPNISGIIAWNSALKFLEEIGIERIQKYEKYCITEVSKELKQNPNLLFYAKDAPRSAIIALNLLGIHSFDVGCILDRMGIFVRTGHHCVQPLIHALDEIGIVRASFAVYNTLDEAEQFCSAIIKAYKILS
ncbi:cysteine desulfurase [Candidatus Uzinura diaspidicola str. ASNER]|uniref:Cysteine desulfurase n=1 Tax=Candidatus Uzinura diaspidicola str. ASNER TaxID=1133592 RepID=L7VJJ2_9FLAO|nr:cysteine desulfurase [Candidatus Uzinura diaspidicola str. ASNER]